MSKSRFAALAVAIALAGPASAQTEAAGAPEVTADTVVATVNGMEITVGNMILAKASLPEQYQQVPDEQLFPGLLEQMIQQAAVASGAGDLSKRAMTALENERRNLLVSDVIGTAINEAVTEEALRAAYEANYANAEPEEEFNAAHILVETEEEAADLKGQLDDGADFAELAREHSTGPSGPNGGDLGWFGKGMMVPEFEAAVLALEVGETSDPVQTQFGWHVVRLNERRQKDAPPFEQVQGQLAQQLQQETIQSFVQSATDASEITRAEEGAVPPSVLSDVSLLDD